MPAEVWYQVQSVLTAHKSAVEATQIHDHYLKGTIHCGQCGSRLIVSNAKNRHGNVYCYFVCSGRHSQRTTCDRSAILIADIEKLIEDYYQRIQITPAQHEGLAGMLHHEFDQLMSAEVEELAQLTANRDRLQHEQERLLQAHYADAIPLALLKREQDRILGELDQVNRRIDAHHGEYADARAHLDDALNLLANCADIYSRCDDANRRLCNQAFFTKVYIDEDDELRVENNRPFEMLLDPEINANALTWAENEDKARTTANDSVGKGSSLVRGVDLRREFENPSSALVTVASRRSRSVYKADRRPLEPTVVDSRGRMVRAVGMTQTFLIPAQVDELVARYQAGATLVELGERFSVHRRTVAAHLVRRSVPIRGRGLDESHLAKAVELYADGLTLMEVGSRFGVSQQTVRRALAAEGVVIRPGGRRARVSA
ncbi:recombinase zinc beta ribbon domain-containing protein [Brachybacterium sacelli]